MIFTDFLVLGFVTLFIIGLVSQNKYEKQERSYNAQLRAEKLEARREYAREYYYRKKEEQWLKQYEKEQKAERRREYQREYYNRKKGRK